VRRNLILGTLALVFLTILAYWPVLNGSSGFIWDDDGHVTANTALHDATGLASIWTWGPHAFFNHSVKPATQQYYPATFTSFWIEYQLWQNQPTGYHITNVALHLISSLLLWRILQRLGLSPGISFFAAALFAVHPVNVESVAWVSERKNTLSLVFYLLAALCWLRWANISKPAQPVGPAPTRDAPSPLWLVLATALFLLALLAKSVTASLPAALMVILWWKRGRISRRELLGLLPLFLLALASAALTISIEHTPGYIGASGPDFNLSFSARCIIAGRALLFYIAKLLLPIHLLFFYPRWQIEPAHALQWLAPTLILAALVLLLALRKSIGRSPLTLALLFVIALFPALGFINFYPMQFSFVADHFQYLATLASCTAIAALLALFARWINLRPVTIASAAAILCTLTALSFAQTHLYRDEITLYRKTLQANPDAWIAADNLASLLARQPDATSQAEALALSRTVLSKHFSNPKALLSIGNTFFSLQQFPEAEQAFARALAADPHNPDIAHALGDALLLQNQPDKAIPHYESAANGAPENPDFLASLGLALLHAGRPAQAETQFRAALDLHIGNAAHYQFLLGQALRAQNQMGAALAALTTSIKLDPKRPEPFVETAEILVYLHKDSLAIDYFQSALHVKKDDAIAKIELARLLLLADEPDLRNPLWAADLFRQVIEESPHPDASLRVEYAGALAAAKFYEQAIDVLQQALNQQPPLPASDHEAILAQIQKYKIQQIDPVASTDSTPRPSPVPDPSSAPHLESLPAPVPPKYIPPP